MTQRQEIIERLRNVDLGGGSHESLSALAKAVYEPAGGWTIVACEALRQTLVRLLGEADAELAERYVELPKDANGEYIHVGDKLVDKLVDNDDKPLRPAIVKCILYNDEGCVVSHIDPRGCWYEPSLLRHYHAPIVEDMLRDMHAKLDEVTALYVGEAIDSDERDSDEARIFAEYAAKLRLAGSDAE